MKIKSIAISNVLSFEEQVVDSLEQTIVFGVSGRHGSKHIIIGPNGAGKSNLIEIINACFKQAFLLPVNFNEAVMMNRQPLTSIPEKQKALVLLDDQLAWPLSKHHGSESDTQKIDLVLHLNDNDRNNLKALLMWGTEINQVTAEFSSMGALIPDTVVIAELEDHGTIRTRISYNAGQSRATVSFPDLQLPYLALYQGYLVYFRLFQQSIRLFNEYLRTEQGERIPMLKETFALLGAYRNYGSIDRTINVDSNRSLESAYARVRQEKTRSGGNEEPAVFDLVKRKLGISFYDHYVITGQDEALEQLYSEEPLKNINRLLSKYLRLSLRVSKPNPVDPPMQLTFYRNDTPLEPSDLSSGEKSIIHFIFTLYGFDLEHGLIVIDEPELHLHHQMQIEYRQLIDDAMSNLDIQFILATHSPLFVNAEAISQVHRCVKPSTATRVISPTITTEQKPLTKILDLSNSSRIFFANRAILVEGETDEYFFGFLINYLARNADQETALPWQKPIGDFEIFNIKGKGGRKVWTDFLRAYGLDVFFIGDWDNVCEVAAVDVTKYSAALAHATKSAGVAVQTKGSSDGAKLFKLIDEVVANASSENIDALKQAKDYTINRVVNYGKVILNIREQDVAEWTRIEQAIERGYDNKIYILKNGELEDYLGLEGKGLDRVITFCNDGFDAWFSSDDFAAARAEILRILERIFT